MCVVYVFVNVNTNSPSSMTCPVDDYNDNGDHDDDANVGHKFN